MKSSTLRLSNIKSEKMAMLSALSEYNYVNSRNIQHAGDKQAELDMLWRNFKISATSEKSPKAYFSAGFFTGIVASLIIATLVSFVIGYSSNNDVKISAPKTTKENVKLTFVPADKIVQQEEEAVISSDKEYTVQAGDSLEDISIRFYGRYDETKIKAIQVKNNLKDINSIKIGQKLLIPME